MIDAIEEHCNVIRQLDIGTLYRIADMITHANKTYICGCGGSAADSQHFAAELVGRYKRTDVMHDAEALTADTALLTALANDFGFKNVFKRQLEAKAVTGDLLIAITTSGQTPAVWKAVKYANSISMRTALLTSNLGFELATHCDEALIVLSDNTPRIQEAHITAIHIICEIIDD